MTQAETIKYILDNPDVHIDFNHRNTTIKINPEWVTPELKLLQLMQQLNDKAALQYKFDRICVHYVRVLLETMFTGKVEISSSYGRRYEKSILSMNFLKPFNVYWYFPKSDFEITWEFLKDLTINFKSEMQVEILDVLSKFSTLQSQYQQEWLKSKSILEKPILVEDLDLYKRMLTLFDPVYDFNYSSSNSSFHRHKPEKYAQNITILQKIEVEFADVVKATLLPLLQQIMVNTVDRLLSIYGDKFGNKETLLKYATT